MKIYAYRFLWRLDGENSLNVKVVCGSLEEVQKFEDTIVSSSKIITASKEYLYEVDLEKMADLQMIKIEKEEENNEKNSCKR